ncbi:hypothetical protein TNCV_348281 [Trichonephila clavipes]|nr:hypothetical protein TNCV_348281 [Trichonephila clavipes]
MGMIHLLMVDPEACDELYFWRESLHAEIVEVEIEVVLPSIVLSGNFAELNRTVTCMVLKANNRRTSCPCHDEFRGPRSDYVRQKHPLLLFTKSEDYVLQLQFQRKLM